MSVLESNYIEAKRPYSQDELDELRHSLSYRLRLGNTMAIHKDCGHFYFVKKNGKKEREIIDTNNYGNCSVCWKLNKTPEYLYENALQLIETYKLYFDPYSEDKYMTYSKVELENIYYKWLYEEFI